MPCASICLCRKGLQPNKKLKNLQNLAVRKVGLPQLFLNFFYRNFSNPTLSSPWTTSHNHLATTETD